MVDNRLTMKNIRTLFKKHKRKPQIIYAARLTGVRKIDMPIENAIRETMKKKKLGCMTTGTRIGDWVLITEENEFFTCSDETFRKNYEETD